MSAPGKKYQLAFYQYMLDRYWPMTLLLTFFMVLNVGVLWGAEYYFMKPGENMLPVLSFFDGLVYLGAALFCLVFTIYLLGTRKNAYVRLFDDHLMLATPFFRINISLKRVENSVPSQIFKLIPPKSISAWYRDILEPLAGKTCVVVHLNSYPMPRFVLRMFFSRFFFYDDTPHFILFLDDWMQFNTELESRRIELKKKFQKPDNNASSPYSFLDDLKKN